MSKILEMRQKRAETWDRAKAFLDEHTNENGVMSAVPTPRKGGFFLFFMLIETSHRQFWGLQSPKKYTIMLMSVYERGYRRETGSRHC